MFLNDIVWSCYCTMLISGTETESLNSATKEVIEKIRSVFASVYAFWLLIWCRLWLIFCDFCDFNTRISKNSLYFC